jgi:hypothetical protein
MELTMADLDENTAFLIKIGQIPAPTEKATPKPAAKKDEE